MKNLIRTALLAGALSTTLMAGMCSTIGGRGGAFCDVEKPIRLSGPVIAVMNHGELAAAVAHNQQGAADCGWRP